MIVFTDPARTAASDSSVHNAATSCLCGMVTLTPAKPSAARPRKASANRGGATGSAT